MDSYLNQQLNNHHRQGGGGGTGNRNHYQQQFINQDNRTTNTQDHSMSHLLPPRNRDKSPATISQEPQRISMAQGNGTPTPTGNGFDSNDAKALCGKTHEEIRLIKQMRQKLQTTTIPKLEFEDMQGNVTLFSDYYDYIKPLGCGSFGFVVSAVDRETGEYVALKILDTSSESSVRCIKKEAEILEKLGVHQNVIRFRHIKEFSNHIVLAIENAHGGTLADLIKRRSTPGTSDGGNSSDRSSSTLVERNLSDDECALIIKGILQGVKHIHSHDYVHRDLKPSNVVIDDQNNLETVKIVDFGLAIKVQLKHGLDDTCGTLVYQAPEQMYGDVTYGKPIDIWAVGIIMYEIISGVHPTWQKGEDKSSYREKMKSFKKITFNSPRFTSLAINLIEKLCHQKPSARYKVDQALQHPWITRNFSSQIPRTLFEESIFQVEIDNKLRQCCHIILFLSITKNHHPFMAQREQKHRLAQRQAEEQERRRAEKQLEEEIAEKERKAKLEEEELEAFRLQCEQKREDTQQVLMPQVTPDFAVLKSAMKKVEGDLFQDAGVVPNLGLLLMDRGASSKNLLTAEELDRQLLDCEPEVTECNNDSEQKLHFSNVEKKKDKERYLMVRKSSEAATQRQLVVTTSAGNVNPTRNEMIGDKSPSAQDAPSRRDSFMNIGGAGGGPECGGGTKNNFESGDDRSRSSSSLTAGGINTLQNKTIDKSAQGLASGKPPLFHGQLHHRDLSANNTRPGDSHASSSIQRTQKSFRIHKVGNPKRQQPTSAKEQQQLSTGNSDNITKSGNKKQYQSPSKKKFGAHEFEFGKNDLSRKCSGERSFIGGSNPHDAPLRMSHPGIKQAVTTLRKSRRNSSNNSGLNKESSSGGEEDEEGQEDQKTIIPMPITPNIETFQDTTTIISLTSTPLELHQTNSKVKKVNAPQAPNNNGQQSNHRRKSKIRANGGKRQKSLQNNQQQVQVIGNINSKNSTGNALQLDLSSANKGKQQSQFIHTNPSIPPKLQPQQEVKIQRKLLSSKNIDRDNSLSVPRTSQEIAHGASTAVLNQSKVQNGNMTSTPSKVVHQSNNSIENQFQRASYQPATARVPVPSAHHHPGRKLISSSGVTTSNNETPFDVIKHSSLLKDQKQGDHQVSLTSQLQSPAKQRGLTTTVTGDLDQNLQNTYKKGLQAFNAQLVPCQDEKEERVNQHQSTKKRSSKAQLPPPPNGPQSNVILSPFEQFLHNLMKQNEIEKQMQAAKQQQHSIIQMQMQSEQAVRQRHVDQFIKSNANKPAGPQGMKELEQTTKESSRQQEPRVQGQSSLTEKSESITTTNIVAMPSHEKSSVNSAQILEESAMDVHRIFRNTATNQASTHSAELTGSQNSKALLDQMHVSTAANQKDKNNK